MEGTEKDMSGAGYYMRRIRQATLCGNDNNNNWRWKNYSLLKLSMDAREKSKKRGAKSLRNLRQKKKGLSERQSKPKFVLRHEQNTSCTQYLRSCSFYSSFILLLLLYSIKLTYPVTVG